MKKSRNRHRNEEKNRTMRQHKFMISGGGTGGHIFPAIAIARALQEVDRNAEFLFVGARGRMEMEKVPAAGFKIEGLWISGIQRKLTMRNALFPVKLMSSLFRSRVLIKNFKPDVVIGVGGYASGPLLRVATVRKIPTLIQEQNSFPGITNRILAKRVDRICVAYEGMERWFPKEKTVLTGNPVRQEVIKLEGKAPRAIEHFELEKGRPTVLVVGGSLGARSINEGIAAGLEQLNNAGIQVIWQTGKLFAQTARSLVAEKGLKNIKVHEFIGRMDLAYAIADLVVSRAGAISISELSAVERPVILVPSPHVAEDHQTKNAMALVNSRAALLVKDADTKTLLIESVLKTLKDENLRNELKSNIGRMAHKKAAEAIAAEVMRLVKEK